MLEIFSNLPSGLIRLEFCSSLFCIHLCACMNVSNLRQLSLIWLVDIWEDFRVKAW